MMFRNISFRVSQGLREAALLCKSLIAVALLAGCSTNPATGQQQFTALMSPQQEAQVGASEHEKIMQTYGQVDNAALVSYVNRVGAKIAANTERPDVQYKFFVLDDPVVNAFALPGGYVYVTRGLLAQAGSEAELAAVLGHEIGHITGRHSAERYSRGVATSLGAMVLSAALDSPMASQALGVGSDLFLKSYSREQENQADELGLRYMTRAGYHPSGMPAFLTALEANTALEGQMNGNGGGDGLSWFSTHPVTGDRVQNTLTLARQYPQQGTVERDTYLNAIDGMIYGDSPKQGFVRGTSFYHTGMDFTFAVPAGFKITNQPSQVIATGPNGTVLLFDAANAGQNLDALSYVGNVWMQGKAPADLERIEINGMDAATASFPGTVNGQTMTVRIVAVRWSNGTFFRFQMAYPNNASASVVEDLKRTTYSLRRLTANEKQTIRPYRIQIVTAGAGDTAASLARRMPFASYQLERFRTLNEIMPGQDVTPGQKYKIVSE